VKHELGLAAAVLAAALATGTAAQTFPDRPRGRVLEREIERWKALVASRNIERQ
jgi:hypothetical protein